jgi:hypothetical protein
MSISPRLLIFLLAGLTTIITACANISPPPSILPTPISQEEIPTAVALTAQAAQAATQTVIAGLPTSPATHTPGPAPSITPTSAPLIDPNTIYPTAVIQLYRPGPISKVASPFRIVANMAPGADGNVLAELLGEDGRVISRQLQRLPLPPGRQSANLLIDLPFEIEAVAEVGRLEISVTDEFGRKRALASVDLFLLSDGFSEVTPYIDLQENIIIQQPIPGAFIEGDFLFVVGIARTQSDQPLVVELYSEENKLLGMALAPVITEEGSRYALFAAQVPFSVEQETPARLIVRERGIDIPGNRHLSSVPVFLIPEDQPLIQ